MEELVHTDQVQGPIPSVNYTEIRKQMSERGRNKACGQDDLTKEVAMVLSEMKHELLTSILQRIMTKDIPYSMNKSKHTVETLFYDPSLERTPTIYDHPPFTTTFHVTDSKHITIAIGKTDIQAIENDKVTYIL